MKNLINAKTYLSGILILIALAATGYVPPFLSINVAAAPCPHQTTERGDNGCLAQNYREAQKQAPGAFPSYDAFAKLVDKCQGTDSVNSKNKLQKYLGLGYSTDTENGNCANAIVSCFKNATDTSACTDENVLAIIASCNEGDVGASGTPDGGARRLQGGPSTAGCGTDLAIDVVNQVKDTKYQTNHGMMDNYSNGVKEKECTGAAFQNQAAIDACKQNIDKQLVQCQYDTGALVEDPEGSIAGTTGGKRYSLGKYDPYAISSCMASKAQNEQQCTARGGGTWNNVTKKCTPPPAPTDQNNNNNDNKVAAPPGGNIQPVDGRCGEARVNILICGKDGGNVALTNVLRIILMVLTLLVGVAAVAGLALASMKYANAGDNSGTVSEAKDMIRNIVIGILLYGFLIAIVNWLIPGAVFG